MADLQTNNFTEQDLSVIPPGSLNPSGINLNQVDNSAVIDYEGISNSLYLPPIEEPKTLYTQKQAYEEAFYTVGAYSPNPVEDLWMVSQDLMQKGYINGGCFAVKNKQKAIKKFFTDFSLQ